MRIGLIAPPWFPVPPPGYGGIELMVDALARGLADAGHEVLLAASADSECPVPMVDGMDRADPARLGLSIAELPHVIRAYAAMEEVDVIHDHTLAGPLYAHKPPGIPVATTIHGPLVPEIAEIYAAAEDAAVIAISRDQVSRARAVKVVAVIHHGIPVTEITFGGGQGGYALFLGRMSPDKGIVQAIHIARAAGIPLRIAAKVREPQERAYFRDVVEPLLGESEEFLGEPTAAEKYELLGNALALVNPIQWSEPFGLVMIEALACGTPVLATPRGAAPEIVDAGVTGFLAADESELARLLAGASGLDRSACRRAASERFSTERMVSNHLRLYEQLADGSSLPALGTDAAFHAAGLPSLIFTDPAAAARTASGRPILSDS